ncbi:ABC transporter permease [Candidatus Woesearchaeota archaeon]|nr:ABC transporter permease [Candidatus Woesearchaeota archaeon]
MWSDYFRLAFKTFASEKKRTALTLIGIFIGIAAVVSLISLGQGLKASIDKQFELLGTDKIFIQPGTSVGLDPTVTIKLTEEDLTAIRGISGVKSASAMVFKLTRVTFKDDSKYTFAMGMEDPDIDFEKMLESFGVEMEQGRGAEGIKDVVLGKNFITGDFLDSAVEVGDKIEVEGKLFRVVGSVSEVGNPQDDANVYLTFDAALELFDLSKDELDFIYVTVRQGEEPSVVGDRIKKKLRKLHDVKEGDEDFTVSTTEDYMETFGIVLTVVQIVLIGIAAISLLVGGVNIANTMYTSVLERTNEIGIMKAIGARNSDIFLLFLIESGILGVVGGIAGIAAGIGMSKLVAFAAASAGWSFIQTLFPWYLTFGALVFSFVVGAVAGTLPARQASKLKPVDALRYE